MAPKCEGCCLLEYCEFGQGRLNDLQGIALDPRS
jgi:hypothetical protein